MRTLRTNGMTRITLEELDTREVPAVTCTWLGTASTVWSEPDNWQFRQVPGPDDTAILSGTPANPPTIAADTNPVIYSIEMQASARFDLKIDGTLYVKTSAIQPTELHGFVGSGALRLDNTAAAVDHTWTSGYVKVPDVQVRDGGTVEVKSTFGQLGPDEFFGVCTWKVGAPVGGVETAGTLLLNGDHFVGFDHLQIGVQGEAQYLTGGTLTDVPLPPPQAWSPFDILNKGKFEIAEGQAVALTGGSYKQGLPAGDAPTTTFRPGTSLTIGGFAGASLAPTYSFDVEVGKIIAYETAGVSAKTDILLLDCTFDFYSPGVFTKNGGPEQRSTFTFSAKDGYMSKQTLIKNTQVKFIDWNPVGRYTSATLVGGRLDADGKVKLDGTSELVLRVDVGNNRMDTVFAATNSVTMNGNALKLTLDVRNSPGGQMMFAFNDFLWATALTCPDPPFGGGVTVTAGGWTPTITVHNNTLDLVMVR